jgi:hypothetical protein
MSNDRQAPATRPDQLRKVLIPLGSTVGALLFLDFVVLLLLAGLKTDTDFLGYVLVLMILGGAWLSWKMLGREMPIRLFFVAVLVAVQSYVSLMVIYLALLSQGGF